MKIFKKKFILMTAGINFNKLTEKSDIIYLDNFDDDGRAEVFSDYNAESLSFFTRTENKINKNIKLSFGIRHEHNDVDFTSVTLNNADYSYYDENSNKYISTPTLDSGRQISKKSNLFGGNIKFENKLNDKYTIFLSYDKGYKAAGANSSSFRVIGSNSPLTYDAEKINTYEISLAYINPEKTYRSKFNIFYLTRINAQLRDAGGSKDFSLILHQSGRC